MHTTAKTVGELAAYLANLALTRPETAQWLWFGGDDNTICLGPGKSLDEGIEHRIVIQAEDDAR